jgi:hypothetical protein
MSSQVTPALAYPTTPALDRVRDSMAPTKRHDALMSLLVADMGESPATRTLRQLLASGVLDAEQEKHARAAIKDPVGTQRRAEQEEALAAQAQKFRTYVARLVGERRADSVMAAIRPLSRATRPLRRALVARRKKGP